MRKTGRTLGLVAMAALVAGMTTPALAATSRHGHVSRSAVAFRPGSGQSVVDWNRELITILGTTGTQPATVHPTRSFAILQAAEYDAVTSITHHDPSYLFSVPAPADARPDAAADQAAHDVLTALYPSMKTGLDTPWPSGSAAGPPSSWSAARPPPAPPTTWPPPPPWPPRWSASSVSARRWAGQLRRDTYPAVPRPRCLAGLLRTHPVAHRS